MAFGEHQRRFKPFMDDRQRSAARFGWWFAPMSGVGLRLRNAATNLMRVPYVGEWLAARSFGDRFELPV